MITSEEKVPEPVGDTSEPMVPELSDEDESEEESSDEEPIIPFLATREKRANAGNRMRALLEHETIEQEELFKEEEDDVEFEAKDEEDVFDSDFGSTDSGSGDEGDGEDAGEKQLQREAKAARREAMGKKAKKVRTPFLPSFARQTKHAPKNTSNAVASTSALGASDQPPPAKRKKFNDTIFSIMPRESSRKSAVAFKKTIEERLQESEQRRLSLPKPKQKAVVSLTQADLIVEALETEEINRASLLAFYAAEEDRRAADRIAGMRYEIIGPKVTFLSRLEGVKRDKGKGKEVADSTEKEAEVDRMESGRRRLIEVIGEAGKEGWKPEIDVQEAAAAVAPPPPPVASDAALATPTPESMDIDTSPTKHLDPDSAPEVPTSDSALLQTEPTAPHADDGPSTASSVSLEVPVVAPPLPSSSTSELPTTPVPAPTPAGASLAPPSMPTPTSIGTGEGEVEGEPHARNYLILEDFEGTKQQEMGALFGNHHQWGTVKVIPSRSRVLNRKIPTCAVTGLPAPYREPRTMTPYATIAAYQTLKAVISQDYIWNDTLGAFTGSRKLGLGKEVEDATPSRKVRELKEKEKEEKKEKVAEKVAAASENPYVKGYVSGSGGASARAARRESKGEPLSGELPP